MAAERWHALARVNPKHRICGRPSRVRPRRFKERGSAGTEALRSCCNSGQPCGARAWCSYAGRGCETHHQADLRSRPAALSRALVVPGPSAAALCQLGHELGRRSRRAARATIAGFARASHTCPGPPRERASRRRCERSNAASGRAPALPRNRRSADASLVRQGWRRI